MERQLHLLETFFAVDEHGRPHKVCGYEHLALSPASPAWPPQWEPTGIVEYKLEHGEALVAQGQGRWRAATSGMQLSRA
ncbi:MAG: hypothetical protein KGL43_28030 [Burkholderiales bacterium]|nr:hypothetical protein [Burkholderiales bacterium]MDE2396113.1 hypothetical protein [Burkholderiales bacterium]MDE2457458.1 hypothetical protein [Burkholderiales bacterium]